MCEDFALFVPSLADMDYGEKLFSLLQLRHKWSSVVSTIPRAALWATLSQQKGSPDARCAGLRNICFTLDGWGCAQTTSKNR